MPAVSVCDPVVMSLRHNLDAAGSSKSADDHLNINASRILCAELDYEETDNYRAQDHLKSKYMVLSLPKQENSSSGDKSTTTMTTLSSDAGAGSSSSSSCGSKATGCAKEPRLPEPKVVLYEPEKISLGWSKSFPVGAGMYNVGNTCYLNSTLQALFHVPALVNWLLTDTHHDSKCSEGIDRHRFISDGAGECLTCAVAKTLTSSHQKSGESIKPFLVYDKLKVICRTMMHGQQEDAHEFLRYLLEGMEKAYLSRCKATKLDNYSKETTPINQIFGGYIRTEVKCLQCKHISTTFQHFQDLLLDIRKANTLDEALAGYFSQEMLDNNDYKCEACKRRVPACKQFTLERPPKVLCVQLKRFSVMGGKISRHVSFKQTIDMGPYIRRKPGEHASKVVYRLTSMVTHMGPSVNCGHYTAIAQVSSGKFFSFDDSNVRQINLNSVTSTNAYIMIFEMEPSSVANGQTLNSQLSSSKGELSLSKSPLSGLSSYSHSNGMSSSKLLDHGSGSSSRALTPSRNGEGSSSSSSLSLSSKFALSSRPISSYTPSYGSRSLMRDSISNRITSTPPSPPLTSTSRLPSPLCSSLRRSYISSQPTSSYLEKNRLNETSKSGKLVDYDGDSSEDEDKASRGGTFKKFRDEQESQKFSGNNGTSSPRSSNKSNGNSHVYSPRRAVSKSPTSSHHNGNNHHHPAHSNGVDAATANGNGNRNNSRSSSNGPSSRGSSPKNGISNGKAEHHNGSSDKSRDKWHSSKSRTNSPDRKIYAKASSAGLNKGWHVSKDCSPPSTVATANGWDESNSSSSRSNNRSMTPNTADLRSYNGNYRSEGSSHLQKTSLFGYGNMGVQSWNGGKARLDREVDSERRQEKVKRRYDDEDDEYDRGRTKKMKMYHNDHNNRGNDSRYNQFQERQNKWKHQNNNSNNNHFRYNNQPHHRPRHNNNYKGPNHNRRFPYNKSRNWRR